MLILLAIIVVLIFFFIAVYNSIISKKMLAENAWSQIDVQLKRRHDLIPNLVETVKGAGNYEKSTLEAVINARNSAIQASASGNTANTIQAENQLTGALRQLFALSEAYPELKANSNYLQLQEELGSTENRIGFARQHYNDAVTAYNTSILQIPNNFVANFANLKPMGLFELAEDEKKAVNTPPKISF